ncbi:MAG TPA: AAC(3) family N-acetyltransferase [Allosphingosinicella sp.]|nr:AAC(3) family N-acetyltransferase [Allosphingosinicella sp.]
MNKERLLKDLVALGLRAGDVLMIHASLRKLGLARAFHGAGGADLILDALDAAVGPEGTLLMVLGTDCPTDWVNEHPPERRAALLAGAEPFDHYNAPVLPEVGWLAEAFRRRPGTLLSSNPSGRFGARGARAAALLADQPWHDYYGPGSPLDRLCAWGGRILRLGASPDTVTALHFAEYLADLPAKKRTRWDYVLEGPEGEPEHVWIDCLDDAHGIADWDGEDYFALILKAYLALGRHGEGRVGEARSELIDAADLVSFGARWMEQTLARPA